MVSDLNSVEVDEVHPQLSHIRLSVDTKWVSGSFGHLKFRLGLKLGL